MQEPVKDNFENINPDKVITEKSNVIYKYASLWERIIAGIIDHAICLTLFLIIIFVLFNTNISLIFFSSYYFSSAFLLMTFIIEIYYFIFEKYCNGQTPGKKYMGISVINNSSKLYVYKLFIRNFMRCTYLLPPLFFIPDIIIIAINRKHKRFGDLIADTVVVKKYIG